jgi:hypothetical protein
VHDVAQRAETNEQNSDQRGRKSFYLVVSR